ncbi:MAG: hypothetical protein ACHQ53_18300 [Polyangiales bacterium]
MRSSGSRALFVAVLLVCAASIVQTARRQGQAHYLATQRYEDAYYLPPPAWLPVFSLGHREALADLIWLRALIYFGDELMHRGEVKNLYNYVDAMLTLDPQFRRVYPWVSACALYRTGTVTESDAKRVIAYLERGVKLFPDDGELAWTLGADYLYELPALVHDPGEIAEAKQRGLAQLEVAALRGAGPPWLGLATAGELAKLGQREQEMAHLEEVYAQISDPELKRRIEAELADLKSASYAEAFRRTSEELEAARMHDFPYLDAGLYLLVGHKPPFDGTALLLRRFDPLAERFAQETDR